VVALLAGLGVGTAFAYESAKNQAAQLQAQLTLHLQAGQADLEAAKASLKQANASHDVTLVNKATVEFISAKTQFLLTRDLADSSQILRQAEGLPYVRDQARPLHTAVDGVADMGSAISDGGIDLSALAAELIAPKGGGQAGRTLLTVLDQVNTSLIKVRADLQRADTAAAGVDVSVVPAGQQATFLKARATIADALVGMDEFQQFVPIIKEVLGANGPRTYLIEQVNPAELRPGGGFIGTYSVLRADQGSLKLIKSGNAYDLADPRPVQGQRGYVAPPGPLRDLIGTTSWSFIDSNFYPDFPSNAIAAENFVQPRLGVQIDAVIAIDYYAVAKMLEFTGPLHIPGYGVTVDSKNFIPTLIQGDLVSDPAHKAILAATAGPLMQIVSSLPPERWPALLGALNDLASAHHLQVYFNGQTVQNEVARFGWSGQLNPRTQADFMAEVEANVGATKANYFVARHYTVVLFREGNMLHHKITVDIVNNMPYVYRPNEHYTVYFRFLFSKSASATWDNLPGPKYGNPNPPVSAQQLTGLLTIPGYGNKGSAFFEWDTPWQSSWWGQHVIYWQQQPGTANDTVTVTWGGVDGHIYTVNGALTQDRIITLTPTGVALAQAPPAVGALPSLSLG
jgi:Protein of unknown function (DUF4012)